LLAELTILPIHLAITLTPLSITLPIGLAVLSITHPLLPITLSIGLALLPISLTPLAITLPINLAFLPIALPVLLCALPLLLISLCVLLGALLILILRVRLLIALLLLLLPLALLLLPLALLLVVLLLTLRGAAARRVVGSLLVGVLLSQCVARRRSYDCQASYAACPTVSVETHTNVSFPECLGGSADSASAAEIRRPVSNTAARAAASNWREARNRHGRANVMPQAAAARPSRMKNPGKLASVGKRSAREVMRMRSDSPHLVHGRLAAARKCVLSGHCGGVAAAADALQSAATL
jgi:hypothetical protein